MTNLDIAKQFERLTASLQVLDAKKYFFQIRSYQRVMEVLYDLPQEISEIYAEKGDLEGIDGIGPAIEAKIVELLTTGKSKEIEHYVQMMPAGMFPLLDIPGIGAKRAHKLATTFDLKPENAIDELEKVAKAGKIRELDKFGEKSEQEIIENIDRLKHSGGRMTFDEANNIAQELIEYLKPLKVIEQIEPLGSLRRQKESVGDIDLGVSTNDFQTVKESVKKFPNLQRVVANGDNLIRILVGKNNVQVDIKASPPQRWGAFIQHFTGSKDHNIKLRELALKKDLSLSEHGIKLIQKNKKLVEFADEKEFYKYLGLNWIPPQERVGVDEIEKAMMKV